jgi:hypothetical protein
MGATDPMYLVHGKEYEVVGIEDGLYRVIDEEGEDPDEELQGYLYDPASFETVSGSPAEFDKG